MKCALNHLSLFKKINGICGYERVKNIKWMFLGDESLYEYPKPSSSSVSFSAVPKNNEENFPPRPKATALWIWRGSLSSVPVVLAGTVTSGGSARDFARCGQLRSSLQAASDASEPQEGADVCVCWCRAVVLRGPVRCRVFLPPSPASPREKERTAAVSGGSGLIVE